MSATSNLLTALNLAPDGAAVTSQTADLAARINDLLAGSDAPNGVVVAALAVVFGHVLHSAPDAMRGRICQGFLTDALGTADVLDADATARTLAN